MHRKTREIPAGQIAGFFVMLAMAVMLLVGLSWLGSPSAAASTHGRTSTASADNATCHDFWAWAAKPGAERFHALVTVARHADTYLRQDVGELAHAEHVHAVHTAELARGYVADDCTFTGDEGD